MSDGSARAATVNAASPRGALAALAFGNFVVGTGVLIVIGLLEVLAQDLGTSVPVAGQLLTAGALTVGSSAPLLAVFLSRVDRHRLLVLALAGFAVGHFACALAPDYWTLLILRVLTVVGAAIFTPQAAAAAGAMVPGPGRAAAVATAFLGWSIASVAGAPLGTWLGNALGWRAAMLAVAVLAAVAALLVHVVVPRKVSTPPLPLSTFAAVARHEKLPRILLVTAVMGTGMFTIFAYIAPLVRIATGDVQWTSLVMLASGIAGVAGNAWALSLLPRWGPARTAAAALALMAVGSALLPLGHGSVLLYAALIAVWGLGGFAGNSSQQARLATLAPPLTPASVALNTSGIYIGQALGGLLGGVLIAHGSTWVYAASVALFTLALVLSWRVADR
jgi:MFS transporter, DHA1 family, inner membrane transport protein